MTMIFMCFWHWYRQELRVLLSPNLRALSVYTVRPQMWSWVYTTGKIVVYSGPFNPRVTVYIVYVCAILLSVPLSLSLSLSLSLCIPTSWTNLRSHNSAGVFTLMCSCVCTSKLALSLSWSSEAEVQKLGDVWNTITYFMYSTLGTCTGIYIHSCIVSGMSESSGPHSLCKMDPSWWNPASVGKDMPGVQTKIFQPDSNGEGEVRYLAVTVWIECWAVL